MKYSDGLLKKYVSKVYTRKPRQKLIPRLQSILNRRGWKRRIWHCRTIDVRRTGQNRGTGKWLTSGGLVSRCSETS